MASLRLFLLGSPHLELDDRPVEFSRRKVLALLIYLAVTGKAHGRDALAALFYPDQSQSRARAYLRRDLAVLNTTLHGDWLEADRDIIHLREGYWLDAAQFRRLLEECQDRGSSPGTTSSECLPILVEAISLYAGDFLTGFTLRDCPEFDDWQFFQAEGMRQLLASALERLVQSLNARGDYAAAIPHARHWVALDPLHEPAQHALIQLYDRSGQPSAALRQYEEYVELLEEEFGLPPGEETRTLYEAIKAKRLLETYLKAEVNKSKEPEPKAIPTPPVSRPAPAQRATPVEPARPQFTPEAGQLLQQDPGVPSEREAPVISQETDDRVSLALALNGTGNAALAEGDYQAAWRYQRQALEIAAEMNDMQVIGAVLVAIGELWLKTNRPARGYALLAFVKEGLPLDVGKQQKVYKLLGKYASEHQAGVHYHSLDSVIAEVLAYEPPAATEKNKTLPAVERRFVEEELIATGGMGEVYRGRDTITGQQVAIKRLRPDLAAHNPDGIKRLLHEAGTLRQLNHPNIVKILAMVDYEEQPMIVMEYISGGSLHDLLNEQPQMSLAQALEISLELADALVRMHHLDILHRDLKPANVLLAEDGTPRLTDFGVAYLVRQDINLTQEGAILGTTAYLSPEAWRGETLDARSDIWSFGAMLYEMLAGQAPFGASHPAAVMTATLNNPLPDLFQFRPDTPPALAALLKQMLVKERALRLDSMRQVAAGLEVVRRRLG